MVKILFILAFAFASLTGLTYGYFKKFEFNNPCQIRILTSNSFFNAVGEDFKSLYFQKYDCQLNFDVVNGANLITSLFEKNPNRYDVLLGLDRFQILKIKKDLLWNLNLLRQGDINLWNEIKPVESFFLSYDEAPITFFVRDLQQAEFDTLSDFLNYAKDKKFSLAVPLKTTSVLGSLFDVWIKEIQSNSIGKLDLSQIKYVKSWSESFGLFERKIINGFLSFETSEIFYLKNDKIKKVKLKSGHPNLVEYFAFTKSGHMRLKQKSNFIQFVSSEVIQDLILKKNYMWPSFTRSHEYGPLRNLLILDIGIKSKKTFGE